MVRDAAYEIKTLKAMLQIYCRGRHGGGKICPDCLELLSYAGKRLAACPLDPKPPCKNCRVHCFSPGMRDRIKEVMRYAGPRMLLRHPLLTLAHYLGFKR